MFQQRQRARAGTVLTAILLVASTACAAERGIRPAATQPDYDPLLPASFVAVGPFTPQEKAALTPTLVTVNTPKQSPTWVLKEIVKPFGIETTGSRGLPREIAFTVQQRPAWEAAIKLSQQLNRPLLFMNGGEFVELSPPDPERVYDHASQDTLLATLRLWRFQPDRLEAEVMVIGEEKCRVWRTSRYVVTQATDGNGRAIPVPPAPAGEARGSMSSYPWWNMKIPPDVKEIRKLDITLRLWLIMKSEEVEIAQPSRACGFSKMVNGVKVEISDIINEKDKKELELSLNRPKDITDEQWKHLAAVLSSPRFQMRDERGGYAGGRRGSDTSSERVVVRMDLDRKPVKLTFELPTKLREVDVSFSFENLAIPDVRRPNP